MNKMARSFLFSKHILVNCSGENPEQCFHTVFALANRFGIRITKGMELATPDMIALAADELGENIPEPFYRGFPQTVRALTPEEKLFDQLLAYSMTYGLGDFSEARHSVFEEPFERIAFREDVPVKDFVILTEADAVIELNRFVDAMLADTRPLSEEQFKMVCACIEEYRFTVHHCASRHVAVQLLLRFNDPAYARFIDLPDTIRLVEVMNYAITGCDNIKKLNLRNKQRKFIAAVLDILLEKCSLERDLRECFEKRALWVGLLHHIHYEPRSETGKQFVDALRNAETNLSAYAAFEKELREGRPVKAAEVLHRFKGSGAVARNLNYILSRCSSPDEVNQILKYLESINTIIMIQMILQYRGYAPGKRVFKFVHLGLMKKHSETDEEMEKRRSVLSGDVCRMVADFLQRKLEESLGKHRCGRVYIDEAMKKIALPLQEGTSSSGFGVLPRGTRLAIPEGKKIRCFTYWEKVDDIDLSAFGIDEDGSVIEFSWRTAWRNEATDAIVYSGDETSGYDGGSEYLDIDFDAFMTEFPTVRYIVLADNVFTGINFEHCSCRAGYMMRSTEDSGEVFEPKTVRTAFRIDAKTTYAVLFAVDIKTKEIVWLNIGMSDHEIVAGEDNISFILPYMDILETASIYGLFAAKADEIVNKPEEADLIVSDETLENIREDQIQIHSYDYEKLFKYLNE